MNTDRENASPTVFMDSGLAPLARPGMAAEVPLPMTSPPCPRTIYKICDAAAWRIAERIGEFAGASVDLADGYIHFSAADQVVETAARHFAGQHDLVLVAVDAAALGTALKWEPSRGGALFPHLYGPLPLSPVRWTKPLPLGPDGGHLFPELEVD